MCQSLWAPYFLQSPKEKVFFWDGCPLPWFGVCDVLSLPQYREYQERECDLLVAAREEQWSEGWVGRGGSFPDQCGIGRDNQSKFSLSIRHFQCLIFCVWGGPCINVIILHHCNRPEVVDSDYWSGMDGKKHLKLAALPDRETDRSRNSPWLWDALGILCNVRYILHMYYVCKHLNCVRLWIMLNTLSPGACWCWPLSCCPGQTAADPADHNGGGGLNVADGDVHYDAVDLAN